MSRALSRCQVTETEIATAQTVWSGEHHLDLSLPAMRETIRTIETNHSTQWGKKKAARRASISEVLTFRNALVRATMCGLEANVDPFDFVLMLFYPAHSGSTWELIFSQGRFEFHESSEGVVPQGLCRVRSRSQGSYERFAECIWTLGEPSVRHAAAEGHECVSMARVTRRGEEYKFHTHTIGVWFDHYARQPIGSHSEPNVTIEFMVQDCGLYWHDYKTSGGYRNLMYRAYKLVSYIAEHVTHYGPKSVMRLLTELGYIEVPEGEKT